MAQYSKKDLDYFRDVVGLSANGIDPYDLRDEHVTESECIEVWGPRRGRNRGFQCKTTHPDKSLQHRIKVLGSLIYQQKVTEFGVKFAMGVLAEKKGIPINWAKFALRREARLETRGKNKTLKRKGDHIAVDHDKKNPPPKKKVNMRMEKEKVGRDVNTSVENKQNKEVKGKKKMMARKNPQVRFKNVDDVKDRQLNVNVENEKVGNDFAISVKKDRGKKIVMTHEAPQVQVGTMCNDNNKHLDVRNDCPNVDEGLHEPMTLNSPLENTNINNKNDMKAPTSSTPQQLGHEEVDARIVLEKNIEDLLSICMTCRDAITTFNNLCSQKDKIDEAIVEATHRMRNATLCLKANQGVVDVKENDDAMRVATELEDARLWHESLLEEKIATTNKIEAQSKNVEDKRNRLKMANQELLGFLLKHYQMFGKNRNILDSMQKQLELLQNGVNELKKFGNLGGGDECLPKNF